MPARITRPPGPERPLSLINSIGEQISPFQCLQTMQDEYGDIFQYPALAGQVCVVNQPSAIKSVLQNDAIGRTALLSMALGEGVLAADSDHWRRQRKLMMPHFRRAQLSPLLEKFAETSREHVEQWLAQSKDNQPLDLLAAMSQLTLSIVSQTMFSHDFKQFGNSFVAAFNTAITFLGDIANSTSFNKKLMISPDTNTKFRTALATMDEAVYSIIRERRTQTAAPGDLLTLLLNATDGNTHQPLTDLQIRDEVITMLLAGHETTSLSMTWIWYLLNKHPTVADDLNREIHENLGEHSINYADFEKLPFCAMVIDEALRLFPPVAAIWRQANTDVTINDYSIVAGTGIIVSPFLAHRHPDFWQEPEQFLPHRFSPQARRKLQAFSYFPFGGGRHTCIGKHFALIESRVILCTVLQHAQLVITNMRPIEPELSITLRPNRPLEFRAEPNDQQLGIQDL